MAPALSDKAMKRMPNTTKEDENFYTSFNHCTNGMTWKRGGWRLVYCFPCIETSRMGRGLIYTLTW
jgi:hypothetical protein